MASDDSIKLMEKINSIYPSDIKRIIGSYEPSNLFVSDEEIHKMILEIEPEFSLYGLYLRYKDYGDKLKIYSSIIHQPGISEIIDIFDQHRDISIIMNNKEITLTYQDRDILANIVGNDNITRTFVGSIPVYSYTIASSDESYKVIKRVILYHVLVNYVNPALYAPIHHDTYNHIFNQPLGSREFKQEYIEEIKKIDDDFNLGDLYKSIAEQKRNASLLRKDILDILIEKYDDILNISYHNGQIYIYSNVEDITINGTREDFLQIVDNLYYGVNVGYELLESYFYYDELIL